MHTKPNKILVLALSGIGNMLMQYPTISAIKKNFPESSLTLWVAPRGTKPLAENHPDVDTVIEEPFQQSLVGHLQHTWQLTQKRFDTAIMLSPGQLWKGAAYMFLSGSKKRIAHAYPFAGNRESGFLLTDSVKEVPGIHDIEQNLNLLQGLNAPVPTVTHYHLPLPEKVTREAHEIIQKLNLSPSTIFIGIHAGCAPSFTWKRWPLENFAAVARTLRDKHHTHTLVFGGPDEQAQKETLAKMIGEKTSIISTELLTAAAVMKKCQLFLSNDSGLMHTSAAVDVPTFGLFGPTDEKTTGPRGSQSYVIRAAHTKPVYHTEDNYNLGTAPHESLLAITPEQALQEIERASVI